MSEVSNEDKVISEKTMLRLMNHCKAEINNKVSGIEEIIPSSASVSNKLATMADVSSGGGGIDFSTTETKIGTFLGADLYSKVYATTGTGGDNLQYKNSDLSDKKIFYAFAVTRFDTTYRSQYVGTVKDGSALGTDNAYLRFTFGSNISATMDVDIIVIYTKIS